MKILLFVALVYIFTRNSGEAIPIKNEDILKSYGGFSHVLLKEKYRRGVGDTEVAASAYSTFGIGYLLAVLHEKVWDLDTRGFNLALKTPYNRITASYIALQNIISEDEDVAVFSDIYTSRENVTFPRGDALRTQVTFIDYNGTVADVDTASAEINARVAVQTYGKIYGKPVPEVGWWGAPFYNYTQGIFTNTFHFGSKLANPILGVFDAEYEVTDYSTNQSRKTKFLETTGYLISGVDADHSAVRIPFTNRNKSLVLVLPNDKISKFVKYELDEYFKPTSSNMSNLPVVRVWIPPLNLTLPNQHNELQKMGITEAVCRYDKRLENVIESIVQYTHISLNDDQHFSVAAVTATHLNNVKEFIEIQTNGTEPSISQEDDIEGRSDLFNSMKTQVPGAGNNRESKVSSEMKDSYESKESTNVSQAKAKPGLPIVSYASATANKNEQETSSPSSNLIKFNRPFFFFLDDVNSGPVFFGSVDNFEKLTKPAPEVVPEGFEWLHDAQKYLLWSCP